MELFHVLNRGVEKRNLFLDDRDRFRFVHDLYEFNDSAPAPEFTRYRDFVNPDIYNVRQRKRIVDVHGWCIMGNHYHLLLSELVEGGLSLFLRKLNVGYANYFNERYKRSGTLFQGRTKKILIDSPLPSSKPTGFFKRRAQLAKWRNSKRAKRTCLSGKISLE